MRNDLMNVWCKNSAGTRRIFLVAAFLCVLLSIGYGGFRENDSSSLHGPNVFAQEPDTSDADTSQAQSPLDQPDSPLLEPKDGNDAAAQPKSPLDKPDAIPTEEPTAVPTKTVAPAATEEPTMAPTIAPTVIPTESPTPSATALPPTEVPPTAIPTAIPTTTPTTVALTSTVAVSDVLTSTALTSTVQLPFGANPNNESLALENPNQVNVQPVTVVPIALSELLGLLASGGTNSPFLTENLILALLCLIGFSVMWLGLCALSVCLFYIRSRQSNYIRDYTNSDRHMVVHYRR